MRDRFEPRTFEPIQPNFAECRKIPGNHGE